MDDETLQAVSAALASMGEPWKVPQLVPAAEPPIPVTGVQWQTVLEDGAVLELLGLAREALTDLDAAIKGSPRSIGRRLRLVVTRLADTVHDLNVTAADVLAFDPPQRDRSAALGNHIERVSTAIAQLLDGLEAGVESTAAMPFDTVDKAERFVEVELRATFDDDDRSARVYGIPQEDLESMRLPVGQSLRAAFSDRQDDLKRITTCIVGFASRGQPMSEDLDGALHPLSA
ncbi:hypothetical protein [Actinoplanes sp. NPDC026623]|uniref:hypothetical protein n=1 Tax=Actinoplanes sp. NPDC026623 TaxID=3155610 RepID=UPI0033CFB13B